MGFRGARRMARSQAKTVEQYLQELPEERRQIVATVRKMVLDNLPEGYVESMNWGMISYEIPLARYPKTYNDQPLSYVGLAAQKNYYTLYLMGVYTNSREENQLRAAFARAGKKLDMGKCCVRFKRLEDLELGALAKVIAATTPEEYIAYFEERRQR